jgi:hypothetical protein
MDNKGKQEGKVQQILKIHILPTNDSTTKIHQKLTQAANT